MRLLHITLFFATTFSAMAQLTGSLTSNVPSACLLSTEPQLTFTGSGGTAPYTFSYQINNGPVQTVTGNPSVTISASTQTPGTFNYTLINIEDALASTTTLNDNELITINNLPIINAGPDQYICQGSSVILMGTGGVTYNWNNGVINGISFVPPVGANTYTVTGMDPNGCFNTDQVTIFVSSTPTVSAVVDSAYCDNGMIQLYVTGGAPPYTYSWSNGATTQNLSQLPGGVYTIYINDQFGCMVSLPVTVPTSVVPGVCASISGKVVIDNDQNCAVSAADNPLQYRVIRALPGNQFTLTDANGNYTLNLLPGTYDIEQVDNSTIFSPSCQNIINVDLPNSNSDVTGINFYDTIAGNSDLQISISTSQIRPLFYSNLYINLCEMSGNPLGTQDIWFTIPSGMNITQFPFPYTQVNDTIYSTITSGSSCTNLWGTIFGTSLTLGDVVNFSAGAEQAISEINLSNNVATYSTIVVASYDPNDKTMFLNGVQSDSTILMSDQVLEYLVRFQNTGTASAIDVYVLDTIAETLDLGTFEFLGSSHPCAVTLENDRTLKFDFPGINLPDSVSNEPASHGYFRYRIRQSQSNQVGTVINNTAYIYFDLNEAVITNTTYDEIVEPTNNLDEQEFQEVQLYPNPTRSDLYIHADKPLLHAVVTDLSGKVIFETDLVGYISALGVQALPSGHYLVRIEMDGGVAYRRFIKQ